MRFRKSLLLGLFIHFVFAGAAWCAGGPPIPIGDFYVAQQDITLAVPASKGLLKNDKDPEGDAISVTGYYPAQFGSVSVTTDGSFSYTPSIGFLGSDSFRYFIGDGLSQSTSATVTILVVPAANRPAVAIRDTYWTPKNTVLSVAAPGVMSNDYDLDGDPFTVTGSFPPTYGTSSFFTDGSFVYTPNNGFSGIDSAIYYINDGLTPGALGNFVTIIVGLNFGADLLLNASFETKDTNNQTLPSDWKAKKISGDALESNVISQPGQPLRLVAFHGNTAFSFTGGKRERSKLSQNVSNTSSLNPGDTLTLVAFVEASSNEIEEGAEVILAIRYKKPGGGFTTARSKIPVPPGAYYYKPISATTMIGPNPIDRITVTIQNKLLTGDFRIDKVSLVRNADIAPLKSNQSLVQPLDE